MIEAKISREKGRNVSLFLPFQFFELRAGNTTCTARVETVRVIWQPYLPRIKRFAALNRLHDWLLVTLQRRRMRFTCEAEPEYKGHVQSIMCRYVGTPRPVLRGCKGIKREAW